MSKEILNAETIAKYRKALLDSPQLFLLYPDCIVVHPTWFYNRDGTSMTMARKTVRMNAIRRLVQIRLSKVNRRMAELGEAAAIKREQDVAAMFMREQKDNDN